MLGDLGEGFQAIRLYSGLEAVRSRGNSLTVHPNKSSLEEGKTSLGGRL